MKKIKKWQLVFAVCCLIYTGWIVKVGDNEFNRINGQYRRLVAAVDADRIMTATLEELSAECIKESGTTTLEKDDCLAWPAELVAARRNVIEERRLQDRQRGLIKLILFYAGFVVFFLFAPPALLYLLIAGIISLCKNIKIIR